VAKQVKEKLTRELDLSLPDSIHAALEADSVAFDKSMQDIAREVLQIWADRKHRAYTVYARRLLANGMQTELPGFETGDDGMRRDGRK
jgi:hypothetical protein